MTEPLDLDALEAPFCPECNDAAAHALRERVRRAEGALREAREYVRDHPRLVSRIDAVFDPEQGP